MSKKRRNLVPIAEESSPNGNRTRISALRGPRPKPLDDRAKKTAKFQAFFHWFLLPRQGSNLNSSDPESDVLPVTPRGNVLQLYQYTKREILKQYKTS
jgi:hypothetical protein